MNAIASKNLKSSYDVVIVGGGIHGSGVAQACAASGYDCLLLEKQDWGWATSGCSSKLIHGGLRYLQTGQFRLVYECLHERGLLLKNAPGLVRSNWFYVPVYHDSRLRPWKVFTGLSLYRFLSGDWFGLGDFRVVSKKKWGSLSGLRTENLQVVFAYQDAQTNDKQLTVSVKNSAEKLGAHCLCPAQFLSAEKSNNGWRVLFKAEGKTQDVACSVLINASGPWVNETIDLCSGLKKPTVEAVQGSHILLNQSLGEHCFYLEAPDGRVVFVLPWLGNTLVGTTETPYQGRPDDAKPLQKEIDYLLACVKHYFPGENFEVLDSFAGLRVLPDDKQDAFFRSRGVRFLDDRGLISLYGGKLTSYRATAEKLIQMLPVYCGKRVALADTKQIKLQLP